MLQKIADNLEWVMEKVIGLLCIILLLCLFVEVLNRYILFTSWPEIQFIIPFCFLWMIMLGSAIAVRRGEHFEVDLLHKLFKGKAREAHRILMLVSVIGGGLVLAWSASTYFNIAMMRKNPATGIPLIYIFSSIFAGGLVIALFGLERLIGGGSDDEHHDAKYETGLHEAEEMQKHEP